jgi:hypothetical protein
MLSEVASVGVSPAEPNANAPARRTDLIEVIAVD